MKQMAAHSFKMGTMLKDVGKRHHLAMKARNKAEDDLVIAQGTIASLESTIEILKKTNSELSTVAENSKRELEIKREVFHSAMRNEKELHELKKFKIDKEVQVSAMADALAEERAKVTALEKDVDGWMSESTQLSENLNASDKLLEETIREVSVLETKNSDLQQALDLAKLEKEEISEICNDNISSFIQLVWVKDPSFDFSFCDELQEAAIIAKAKMDQTSADNAKNDDQAMQHDVEAAIPGQPTTEVSPKP